MDIGSEVNSASERELAAYLTGASRDGTISRRHGTLRIAQSGQEWLTELREVLTRLETRGWTYQEGQRGVWVLETKWKKFVQPASLLEKAAFARGYFDAEGGIPRDPRARFYIQIVQKNLDDLRKLWFFLHDLKIACGRIHNPSARVDPDYWRFYIRTRSQIDFIEVVSSWHPRKRSLLDARLKAAKWP